MRDKDIKKVVVSSGSNTGKQKLGNRKMVSSSNTRDKMIRNSINKGK